MRLSEFAFIRDSEWKAVADAATAEYWGDGTPRRPYSSLVYYCEANFEIGWKQAGQLYEDHAKRFAVWRIGHLISQDGRPLYLYLTRNPVANNQPYHFNKVLTANRDGSVSVPFRFSPNEETVLRDLAGSPVYNIPPYSPDYDIEIEDMDHLVLEHPERLSKVLPMLDGKPRVWTHILSSAITEAHSFSRHRKIAVPQYFIPQYRERERVASLLGNYQQLLPLYITTSIEPATRPDLVAAIETNPARSVYKVITLLLPEMAYRTARCLAEDDSRLRAWNPEPQTRVLAHASALVGRAATTIAAPHPPKYAAITRAVSAPLWNGVASAFPSRSHAAERAELAEGAPPANTPLPALPRSKEEWVTLGNEQYRAGGYQEALDAFNQAIALDPRDAQAHCYKGHALKTLKRLREAIAAYDEAILQQEQYFDAYFFRGEALKELGEAQNTGDRWRENLAAAEAAAQPDPNRTLTHPERSHPFKSLRDYEGALADYTMAARLQPDRADIVMQRAFVLRQLERFPEALRVYKELPAYEAARQQIHALERLQPVTDALLKHKREVSAHPDQPTYWQALGEVYAQLGMKQEAQFAFQRARELGDSR